MQCILEIRAGDQSKSPLDGWDRNPEIYIFKAVKAHDDFAAVFLAMP